MANEELADGDLVLILEHKNDLLRQWVDIGQQQLAIQELVEAELELLLRQKEQLMDELRRLDKLMESWGARHPRSPNHEEVHQLRLSETLLQQIQEAEEAFMTRLQEMRQSLSKEMGRLRSHINYVQPNQSRVGRLMNLRRNTKV